MRQKLMALLKAFLQPNLYISILSILPKVGIGCATKIINIYVKVEVIVRFIFSTYPRRVIMILTILSRNPQKHSLRRVKNTYKKIPEKGSG